MCGHINDDPQEKEEHGYNERDATYTFNQNERDSSETTDV
jgi:hypothetical protein